MEQEILDFIHQEVAAAFASAQEIEESVSEVFWDQYDMDALWPEVHTAVQESLAAHLREQVTWPEITDCDRLDQAFAHLEKNGIISRQNYTCCGNCGSLEIWDEVEQANEKKLPVHGYTFYHQQDTESAVSGSGLYLNYGSTDEGDEAQETVAHEIVAVLREHGLQPEWSGDVRKRIHVPLDWKRRRESEK